jgi:hypothetical protein
LAYTILGGRLSGPVELTIRGQLPVTLERAQANCDSAAARNLPGLQRLSRRGVRLAVVGGGPSINDHVEGLKSWATELGPDGGPGTPGEIWAINGAWNWCHNRGIEATFFAIDAHPIVTKWAVADDGSKPSRAILAMTCDPAVFDLLEGIDINAVSHGRDGLRGGSSTAGLAPHLAALMGYSSVTFFGCESSYAMGRSHAYQHETRPEEIIVSSNGCDHLTAPDFMLQAGELATFLTEFPEYLSERSGGLLRAMMEDRQMGEAPSIRWMSDAVVANLGPMDREPQHGIGKATAEAVPIPDNFNIRQAAE